MHDHTNSLARAASAYLRSAMHQPIQWNEWGDEALSKARRENKPVLLDIGAVWCHWCHVMDRESYDDPAIAELINREFVPIKVDRDERPDVDSRYQAAVQAVSGQGGWPLTAFLMPDGRPFYGGTYFPPQEGMGRPSFRRVLEAIAGAFRDKQSEVLESAAALMGVLFQAESFAGPKGDIAPDLPAQIAQTAMASFDPQNGGFGTAPKFPHPTVLDLLMEFAVRGNEQAREVALTTLDRMAKGGVYDQLAGGFHRYSVDERWIVPHFEKMAYDNSELLKNYVHGFQISGDPRFAFVARDIMHWMDQWLSDRERGGFYASQDADLSPDDDGDYFTWTLKEAAAELSPDELEVVSMHYDIGETGEMHNNHFKNVLWQAASVGDIARKTGHTESDTTDLLERAKGKLYAARLKRPTPFLDKTIYVGWNALCISAYIESARVLSSEDARHFALRSLDRILSEAWNEESGLRHVIAYSDPTVPARRVPGVLDDYAFTVLACLNGYEITADLSYLQFAQRIADTMIARFHDEEKGGFFDTQAGTPDDQRMGALAAQRKPFQDAPTPAGNSSAALGLLRLYWYTNQEKYRQCAESTLQAFASVAGQYGTYAASYAIAVLAHTQPHTQVVVVGDDAQAKELYQAAVMPFSGNKTVVWASDPHQLAPAFADTVPNLPGVKEGKGVAVVCSDFTCHPTVSGVAELKAQLQGSLAPKAAD